MNDNPHGLTNEIVDNDDWKPKPESEAHPWRRPRKYPSPEYVYEPEITLADILTELQAIRKALTER
ncbi:hypothetical protein H4V95_001981 [Arthrobacter sp. CAN_C5]|nr:hypothetical protein [Arthrobacter sp. CAN_C5]